MRSSLYAVLLAAGSSLRLGSPKQLLEFRGKTLIRHAVEVAACVFGKNIVLVLKSYAEVSQFDLADLTLDIIDNPDWEEGMASSIRAGIAHLPKDASGALVLTIDQPLIGPSQLNRLVEAWEADQTRIVASEYNNVVGVPAVFPRTLFPELKKLQGDRGAKELLMARKTLPVCVPEAGFDVDTWSDWKKIQGKG